MCLDLCRSEYSKATEGCDWGMKMIPSVRDVCFEDFELPNISSEQIVELQDTRLICFQNCKQGCLKLQYKYRIKVTEDSWILLSYCRNSGCLGIVKWLCTTRWYRLPRHLAADYGIRVAI
ncbi:hypothetical protein AVEN_268513-1 [Araneus ventricosus]|uniref:Uncharacterized protein n=1 Tax=Araneus ventricosus TaxID=182803 RepID=A0A4Y2MKS2_ARAVE|nr:hypothetical protein AVEN_268513-1 [Araneus ventricosus]